MIGQIVRQTGQQNTEALFKRWENRFRQWSNSPKGSSPNLVVFIDGLNERPIIDWPRFLDGLTYVLAKIGGRLVVSVRARYYAQRMDRALKSTISMITVPEWSKSELSSILDQWGTNISALQPAVINTLRNPRILGIACELLQNNDIETFEELSVERLLFEHIRTSAQIGAYSETPELFTKRLRSHAKEIIERIEAQQLEDKFIFESADYLGAPRYELSADLLAVSEGRFFNALPEDQNLYELSEEGLAYALGLSIISALQKCERNGRNINEMLALILEPIAALDKAAEAVFAAVLVSSIDERCSDTIMCSLICSYLRLQNIDEYTFPAFCSVVRNATEAAMQAVLVVANSSSHIQHEDWLVAALRRQRKNTECWGIMSRHMQNWLRVYSLDPELKAWNTRDGSSEEKLAEEKAKRIHELDERISALSTHEQHFLNTNMKRDDSHSSSSYANTAFSLLTGMPLADFSEALVAWAFSQALNSDFHSPYDEFQFLMQFNNSDWADTRQALLKESSIFQTPDSSRTGKWALVHILRGTSSEIDALQEDKLITELTADREQFEGWRLVENYCETDPCDPSSEIPDNLADTVKRYTEINLDNVCKSRSRGEEDLFLSMAGPGVARFAPDTALEVHKSLNKSLLSRSIDGPLFRLHSIRKSAALLDEDGLSKLKQIAIDLSGPYVEKRKGDGWVKSQYGLLLALPHLSGNEQLEFLLSLPNYGPPLLDLADILKPAESVSLENALESCAQSDDENFKMTILMFARYSGSIVSPRSKEALKTLLQSSKSATRAQAMNLVAYIHDRELINQVADSDWNANELDKREAFYERLHGAELLADSVKHGYLAASEALDRVSPEHYGLIASASNASEKQLILGRINAAIGKALDAELPFIPPSVATTINDERKAFEAPLQSLEDSSEGLGIDEFFKRVSEKSEDFEERQAKGWNAFCAFEDALTKQGANLIIENTSYSTIKACLDENPMTVNEWAQTFMALTESKLMRVQNIALIVAECLSENSAELSAGLFRKLMGGKGYVNIVSGIAAIPVEALCAWRSSNSSVMKELRWDRLDSAATDDAIAVEVLAAIHSNKHDLLNSYAAERMASGKPSK